jgi:uncharacterized protein YdiU (UPF0061 family)
MRPKEIRRMSAYRKIERIDGRHPFKDEAPFSYVEYNVRKRPGGKVRYVNFDLARSMGLVPADHADRLTEALSAALLQSFAGVIINEYDLMRGKTFDPREVKKHRYMATRYLQLQHPGRTGRASGDGRSIWNGVVHHQGKTWDVSSRGTGATCLSPATAKRGRFFRSGDPEVSYGCGFSNIHEGVGDAIFSEIFHRNNVATERVLCIIEFPGSFEITVRASPNLLRPSHFFVHLKQGHRDRLRNVADYFIERQLANKAWAPLPASVNKYDYLLRHVAAAFAQAAARFEEEYIFCWLDWDGDNIMADGGIIDYGSIRQFGLCHDEYRYDDDDRWSTNLKEQRHKARLIVQTFAQAVDFLKTGTKKPLHRFKNARAVRDFDALLKAEKRRFFLRRVGFAPEVIERVAAQKPRALKKFQKLCRRLETAKTSRGETATPDGVTHAAIFNMRSVLRELPQHLVRHGRPMTAEELLEVACSPFASRRDRKLTAPRRRTIARLQKAYRELCAHAGVTFADVAARAALINRQDRITGDGLAAVEEVLVRNRNKITSGSLHRVITAFVRGQVLDPDQKAMRRPPLAPVELKLLEKMNALVHEYRDGL